MLTFEIRPDADEIQVHGDVTGLRVLRAEIDALLEADCQTHVHLATPSWAGTALTEETQGEGNKLVHLVTVFLWQ